VRSSPRIDLDRLRSEFRGAFGRAAHGIALAPGRVNLIGEHTDYNGGFVLPMAIDRHVAVAFAERDDRVVRVRSLWFDESAEIDLERLEPGAGGWRDYVAGVTWALGSAGHRVRGVDLCVDGDIPPGAGLSSSAALELAVARALAASSDLVWDPVEMALLCQRAENDYVGVKCGVMDQLASAICEEGKALLLDCRSLATQAVELPASVAVVVMDSGVRRSLAQSEYNRRRASCEAAVEAIRADHPAVRSLRDVTPQILAGVRERLDETVYRRAAHVVVENRRPVALAAALRSGDLVAAGRLMNESHQSLRDLYEVSCAELDRLVELARAEEACFGARLTGAGFGGCAIALVRADAASELVRAVQREYRADHPGGADFFVSRPVGGAKLARSEVGT
jgi:galactokinase